MLGNEKPGCGEISGRRWEATLGRLRLRYYLARFVQGAPQFFLSQRAG